jgi:hypothetical protein
MLRFQIGIAGDDSSRKSNETIVTLPQDLTVSVAMIKKDFERKSMKHQRQPRRQRRRTMSNQVRHQERSLIRQTERELRLF